MNNHKNHIINIFNKAEESIQIAVSWFTDRFLIEDLLRKMEYRNLKLKIVLSADEYNVFRYNDFKKLKEMGAEIRKTGNNNALSGNFMHHKLVIVDNKMVYGGSYNFSYNARTNYENFGAYQEIQQYIADFEKAFDDGIDYFEDIYNPEVMIKRLIDEFEASNNEKLSIAMKYFTDSTHPINSSFSLSEREMIIAAEIHTVKLEKTASNFTNNLSGVNNSGIIGSTIGAAKVMPHKFYGGSVLKTENLTSVSHSKPYQYAYLQKKEIEKSYNFLKCRIIDNVLICTGWFHPENCNRYKVRIEFHAGRPPYVYILSPEIPILNDIHIYKEGCLCLYYPGEMKWRPNTSIAKCTIPWIFEWIMYYEIWKITGEWKASFQPH